jgi:hypothetical protein
VSPKDPAGAGNWSPAILGTGVAADGNTYIGLFRNKPEDDQWLDFNVEITGDTSGECWFKNGKFTGGGDGCTVSSRQNNPSLLVSSVRRQYILTVSAF